MCLLPAVVGCTYLLKVVEPTVTEVVVAEIPKVLYDTVTAAEPSYAVPLAAPEPPLLNIALLDTLPAVDAVVAAAAFVTLLTVIDEVAALAPSAHNSTIFAVEPAFKVYVVLVLSPV